MLRLVEQIEGGDTRTESMAKPLFAICASPNCQRAHILRDPIPGFLPGVTEILAYFPGRFEVIRYVRPTCSCRKCETMVQAPMPDLPIPHGMVDASFLAHIAVGKFCDQLPLYRQAEIYARSGLDIGRSQLAAQLGQVACCCPRLVG